MKREKRGRTIICRFFLRQVRITTPSTPQLLLNQIKTGTNPLTPNPRNQVLKQKPRGHRVISSPEKGPIFLNGLLRLFPLIKIYYHGKPLGALSCAFLRRDSSLTPADAPLLQPCDGLNSQTLTEAKDESLLFLRITLQWRVENPARS